MAIFKSFTKIHYAALWMKQETGDQAQKGKNTSTAERLP